MIIFLIESILVHYLIKKIKKKFFIIYLYFTKIPVTVRGLYIIF